ncbi:MAG: DeoR/GlpR transcriptional regulator [Chloroflexi bacterium]|nr:MAG: DeoR/GlpR transcriptional regulator [Chloroflexota bacterium]
MALIPAERRNQIRALVQAQGSVRVNELSDRFGVSELTIRRDLEKLEQQGILERTHGGAISIRRIREAPLYSEKYALHHTEKQQIGTAAARLVEDGDTVFIGGGSTTVQIFKHLAGRQDLRVVTNNMGAVPEVQHLDLDLILIGGSYHKSFNSSVGPLATLVLRQIYATKCIIGVDGISPAFGLTEPLIQWAEIARLMIERTKGQVIVVADHSKFGRVADYVIAPLDQVDVLVVDSHFDERYRDEIEAQGVQILIAPDV